MQRLLATKALRSISFSPVCLRVPFFGTNDFFHVVIKKWSQFYLFRKIEEQISKRFLCCWIDTMHSVLIKMICEKNDLARFHASVFVYLKKFKHFYEQRASLVYASIKL